MAPRDATGKKARQPSKRSGKESRICHGVSLYYAMSEDCHHTCRQHAAMVSSSHTPGKAAAKRDDSGQCANQGSHKGDCDVIKRAYDYRVDGICEQCAAKDVRDGTPSDGTGAGGGSGSGVVRWRDIRARPERRSDPDHIYAGPSDYDADVEAQLKALNITRAAFEASESPWGGQLPPEEEEDEVEEEEGGGEGEQGPGEG
jgi:hypothetical protein